jgi:iron-sulfur cluster repair protein YtfE (RIC family)
MPNVVELLKQDHREVEALFSQFEGGGDAAVAEKICEELDLHTQVEEQAVYPPLRSEVVGGAAMASHAEKEHAEARQIIGRIRQTKDADHLGELVSELKNAVEEHVNEEENDVFPKMEREMGGTRLEEIGAEVEELKARS